MTDDDTYLIWSNEHRGWWKPGGYGYTSGLNGAGHFSHEDAIRICKDALPSAHQVGLISEIPVRLTDIHAVLRDAVVPHCVSHSKNNNS